jgi:SAM-dependent methyltransferase
MGLQKYKYPPNERLYPCERRFFQSLPSSLRILELGCGTGRVFINLLSLKPKLLVGIDINEDAVNELKNKLEHRGLIDENVQVLVGDAAELTKYFSNNSFDLVVFAFNGIDCLYPISARHSALKEIEKVLAPNGFFYFSSLNPLGIVLSPRGLHSLNAWKFRLRYILTAGFLKRYIMHPDGFPIHQSLPSSVIREVENITSLKFVSATDRTGYISNLFLLTLFSQYPYYLFKKVNKGNEL